MIITVTLNPAIDKTLIINDFNPGSVNRVSRIMLDAGGKGINVSKTIQSLGGKSKALGFLAGKSGEYIQNQLDARGLEREFVYVEGESRTNIKIADPIKNSITDINEMGPDIGETDIKALETRIFENLSSKDVLVLTGSVPKGISPDIYMHWINKAKDLGAKCVLDADGELLRYGLKAAPYLVKPNIHELERLLDRKLDTIQDIVKYAKQLIDDGVSLVAVSRGEKGSVFVSKDSAAVIEGIKIEVKSTVGAGDAMVAALSYGIQQEDDFDKAIRLAAACGTAAVMSYGTQAAIEDVQQVLKQIEVKYI